MNSTFVLCGLEGLSIVVVHLISVKVRLRCIATSDLMQEFVNAQINYNHYSKVEKTEDHSVPIKAIEKVLSPSPSNY